MLCKYKHKYQYIPKSERPWSSALWLSCGKVRKESLDARVQPHQSRWFFRKHLCKFQGFQVFIITICVFVLSSFWEELWTPIIVLGAASASKNNIGGILCTSGVSGNTEIMHHPLFNVSSVTVFDETLSNRCAIDARSFPNHRLIQNNVFSFI